MREEMKYYGYHACLAILERRPQDIIRVYCEESKVKPLGALLKWCANNKKAYHIVAAAELEKVTQSVHHEGVCVLARKPQVPSFDELVRSLPKMGPRICMIYLDDVQNPHNLGSILRVSAHFGVPYILGDAEHLPQLSASSCRIAQGGAEMVPVIPLAHPKRAIEQLKKLGFGLVATSSHADKSLYGYAFPPRTILAFGSESTGLTRAIADLSTAAVQIPGTGEVESLNVSIASALCLGEYWRQQR